MPTTRRSMLRLVGSTIGAGLGVAGASKVATAEPRDAAPDCAPAVPTDVRSIPVTKPSYGTQACAIYCSVVRCRNCIDGCELGNTYCCVAHACGYEFRICRWRACSGFCLSSSAC